jgi:hypothetical protein
MRRPAVGCQRAPAGNDGQQSGRHQLRRFRQPPIHRDERDFHEIIVASITAEGNEDIVRMLLEKKADTAAKTNDGRTALDLARARGLPAIAELLEKAATR